MEKTKITPKEAVCSLIFPLIVLFPCTALFIIESVFALELLYMLLAAASVVVGGVMPIFLTFFYKADTSGYLLGRIIFLTGSAALVIGLCWLSAVINLDAAALLWTALALSVVCPTVYYII